MAHGRSPSRAIPVHAILSVEQTKKAPRRQKPGSTAFELRARAQARYALYRDVRGRLAWCLLCGVWVSPRPRSLAARLAQPNVFQKETLRYFFQQTIQLFLFTDLSMAGLPAELKHITQRRKRKQP